VPPVPLEVEPPVPLEVVPPVPLEVEPPVPLEIVPPVLPPVVPVVWPPVVCPPPLLEVPVEVVPAWAVLLAWLELELEPAVGPPPLDELTELEELAPPLLPPDEATLALVWPA
jgi:hypothetical protein